MRRLRLLAAALAATAMYVAATVAPAAGAGWVVVTGATQACGDETFSSLSLLGGSSTTRTAADFTQREKDTEALSGSTEFVQSTPGKPTAGPVDVYFHVVTAADGTGYVSPADVDEQVAVLNLTFAGFYGGDDTGFTFRLAGLDYTQNQAWYDQSTFADEYAMKSALKRGDATDLNIYSTSGGGFLGWAYYPSITASQQYGVLDGIVLHYGSLPGGYIRNYNLGYTATHEAGHWLGLAHTFEQGCQGHGDYVDDTPFEATPTSGCPRNKDTCPEAGTDPVHNYMDYSYDKCYTEFTAGQTARMQKQFAHWRLKRA